MTDTLERPTETPLPYKQRYRRWLRVHEQRQTRHALIGAVVCAVLVLGLNAVYSREAAPLALEDNPDDAVVSMAMVGDIMFGRHVAEVTERHGVDHPLSLVAEHFAGFDYVTGNLEEVLLSEDPADGAYEEADKFIHLWSGPETAQALADANFTLINLANNHTMDYGEAGLADTMAALEAAGLDHVGAGANRQEAAEIHYQEINEVTVATVGFTDSYIEGFPAQPFSGGALPAVPEVVGPTLRQAASEADLVVAHIHWGDEYDWRPSRAQQELGRQMAEEGADIVVGHHPHVLMPVELHGDSIIFYSLGNFVFDQGWTRTRESVIAGYRLADDGTATIELVPAYIREGRPQPLEGATTRYRQARVFGQLTSRTDGWERHGDVLRLEIDHEHVLGGRDGE